MACKASVVAGSYTCSEAVYIIEHISQFKYLINSISSTWPTLPHDIFQGSTYKYILTGVDVASRFKVAKPLRTKKASDVAFLLKNIYESKANPLKWPEVFQCDKGSEFRADVTKLLEVHNVKINSVVTKYKHTHTHTHTHTWHLSITLTKC